MPKNNKISIVLTGGHAATMGISVIEEIKRRHPSARISWIGTKSTIPGSKATSTEYKIYPSLGVNYYSILAGRLQTKFTRYTIPLILLIPVGFLQAFFILLKLKPKVILSFGGFTSFPVVVWGYLFGIPVILHEQTVVFGRASKASAPFASKIALAREESIKFFPKNKCVVTGNPLLPDILKVKPKLIPGKDKVIFINIGSRGSEFISEEVFKVLPQLLKNYEIFHITGENNFDRYKDFASDKYHVFPFIDPREIGEYYEKADIIISRAGASTISEILYVKRPAIIIPLPRSFMQEQYKNALYAEKFGIARVMTENQVETEGLVRPIEELFVNWKKMIGRVKGRPDLDAKASQRVVDLLEGFLQ